MTPDQKYFEFVKEWAKERGFTFIIQCADGHGAPELIDEMEVDDFWGWMIPEGTECPADGSSPDDDYFGCLEWKTENGKLVLSWETYENES